jgi:hypothetical protein
LLRTARGALELTGDDDAATPAGLVGARDGIGILGSVLEAEAEIVNDVGADPRSTAAERSMASLIAAPLKVRGQRIGIVGAWSGAPVEYRAADLKVLPPSPSRRRRSTRPAPRAVLRPRSPSRDGRTSGARTR